MKKYADSYLVDYDPQDLDDELRWAKSELKKANRDITLASGFGEHSYALRLAKDRKINATNIIAAVTQEIQEREINEDEEC